MLVAMIENEERYFTYQFIRGLDETLEAEMREKFERYRRRRVILNASFDDPCWTFEDRKIRRFVDFSKLEMEYQFVIRQVLEVDPEQMELACKLYVIMQLGSRAITTIKQVINALYRLLKLLLLNDVLEALRKMPVTALAQLDDLFQLFDCESESIGYIQDVLGAIELPNVGYKKRKLAPFLSYFRFSDVMERFWKDIPEMDFVQYFPLWLWWNVTTILPLRPTEFVLTPRDCLTYDETGQAFLTVRRTKMKKRHEPYTYNIDFDYSIHSYPIPAPLADEIETYIRRTESAPEQRTRTLFRTVNGSDFGYSRLAELLREFFQEIVPQYYTVVTHCGQLAEDEICKINLGDTRHISMISLILQGGNPTVCQELAGHEDINISYHYYGNISELVSCMTYELYRRKSRKTQTAKTLPLARPVYGKSVEIEGGRCYSPGYVADRNVDDCLNHWSEEGLLGDCKTCKFFCPKEHAFQQRDLQAAQAEAVDLRYDYLKLVMEQVRRRKMAPSDLDRALMQLNDSVQTYTRQIQEELLWQDPQNTQTNRSYR